MSNITDLKFTESEFSDQDISSLPNQVVGKASWIKAKFDNIGKNKIALGKFNALIDFIRSEIIPSGIIKAFAGNTIPDGWLLCNGQEVSRSTYSDLFETIGITYGSGNGTTTFNIPNLQGKMIIGADSTYTLGRTGGSATAHAQIHVNGGDQIHFSRKSGTFTSNISLGGTGSNIGVQEKTGTFVVNVVGDDDTTGALPPYISMNYIIKI